MQFSTALHRFIMGTDKAASLLRTTFEEGEYSSRVSHCTAAPSPISEHKIEISYSEWFKISQTNQISQTNLVSQVA